MTTVNGCWNCEQGGLEKLLVNLIYSQKAFRRVTPTANVKTVSRKCGINAELTVKPGFICESWKYDEKGYKAKEPSYTVVENMESMREYEVTLKSGARQNVLATQQMMEETLDTIHSKLINFRYNNKHTYIKRDEIVAVDEIAIIEPNEE